MSELTCHPEFLCCAFPTCVCRLPELSGTPGVLKSTRLLRADVFEMQSSLCWLARAVKFVPRSASSKPRNVHFSTPLSRRTDRNLWEPEEADFLLFS